MSTYWTPLGANAPSVTRAPTNVNAANTDLTFPGGTSPLTHLEVGTTGGVTLRSLGAGQYPGQRVVIRNGAVYGASNWFKILHLASGGGPMFYNTVLQNEVLFPGDAAEYEWDGTYWVQVNRNINEPFVQWAGSTAVSAGNSVFTQYNQYNTLQAGTDPNLTLARTAGGITLPTGLNALCQVEFMAIVVNSTGDRLTSIYVGGVELARTYRMGALDASSFNATLFRQLAGNQLIAGFIYLVTGGPQNITSACLTVRAKWSGN